MLLGISMNLSSAPNNVVILSKISTNASRHQIFVRMESAQTWSVVTNVPAHWANTDTTAAKVCPTSNIFTEKIQLRSSDTNYYFMFYSNLFYQ